MGGPINTYFDPFDANSCSSAELYQSVPVGAGFVSLNGSVLLISKVETPFHSLES